MTFGTSPIFFGGEGGVIYEKSNKRSVIELSAETHLSESECPSFHQ